MILPPPSSLETTAFTNVEQVENLGPQDDGFPEALSRGKEWELSYECRSLPSDETVEGDRKALAQLLSTRLEQRREFFSKVESALNAKKRRLS